MWKKVSNVSKDKRTRELARSNQVNESTPQLVGCPFAEADPSKIGDGKLIRFSQARSVKTAAEVLSSPFSFRPSCLAEKVMAKQDRAAVEWMSKHRFDAIKLPPSFFLSCGQQLSILPCVSFPPCLVSLQPLYLHPKDRTSEEFFSLCRFRRCLKAAKKKKCKTKAKIPKMASGCFWLIVSPLIWVEESWGVFPMWLNTSRVCFVS